MVALCHPAIVAERQRAYLGAIPGVLVIPWLQARTVEFTSESRRSVNNAS